MRKIEIWDIIIWISLIVLAGYIIGKLFGIINTPEWVNLIPIITLVFFAGAFYQKVSGFMEKMYHRTNYLKKGVENTKEQIGKINFTLSNQDNKLNAINYKLTNYDKMFSRLEKK